MAARQPLLNFLPLLFSLLSFVLILLILIAGTNNALSTLYYLKTDTTSLSIPSKLSSSTFLTDLSAVSGADFTGSPATSSSLGLAETYTLLILTSCAHFPTSTVCDRPSIGFAFDPASNLKLDSTSLQGTSPPALISSLSSYRRASPFLADAYVISAALVALAPVAALLGPHSRAAAVAAAVLASLASVFLFAAAVGAVVVFRGLGAQVDAAFGSSGLRSEAGVAPVALGFAAFVLALVTAVIFIVRARGPLRPRGRVVATSIGTDVKGGGAGGEGPRPGLWKRIPTWSQHRYVQVERQPALLKTSVAGSMEAVVVTSPAGTRMRAEGDDDWAGEDEYAAGGGGNGAGGHKGIPMLSLGGNKRDRDVNTAYEPYSGDGRGGV
ncbi:hypothetical protein CONLIGDRAFT_703866 [Coniochaeta ligniaria NRRL 30616]|uniref:SUR7-domain-containing protein n=1 Tax=Coniochaeta ligniaria NRRL 30616 TaxID=1408157 RepID=A0A1J7IMD4_9PEZI|nr:hypothetical protein CONLIGDRAFT_703866 [Coniochaeta ligniaria NRRL 30616]